MLLIDHCCQLVQFHYITTTNIYSIERPVTKMKTGCVDHHHGAPITKYNIGAVQKSDQIHVHTKNTSMKNSQ